MGLCSKPIRYDESDRLPGTNQKSLITTQPMLANTVSRNTLRAIRFERPEYIPIVFWINPACW
ncbi:MAG: hypothetical protein ACYTDW_17485, partial [Planctomycetota bacterium]